MSGQITKRFFVVLILFFPSFCIAQIQINEIYYSPKTSSWIEIYNNTDSAVDLTQYKILDAGASVNGHGITASSGTNPLPAHTYAVVATTNAIANFGSVSWSLFKSSLAASTTPGDTIILKLGTNIVDSVVFSNTQGANGDGNSLQRGDAGWITAVPTPGAVNETSASVPSNNSTSTTTNSSSNNNAVVTTAPTIISTHSSFIPLSDFIVKEKFAISAGRDRLGVVMTPIGFQVEANIDDKNASYLWTFGDGSKAEGKKIEHSYEYPGDYAVVVSGSLNEERSISRNKIKVVEPKLEVLNANEQFISIKNNSKEEVNLYGFEVRANNNVFSFPQDTIILPGATNIFPSKITGLSPRNLLETVLKNKYQTATTSVVVLQDNTSKIAEIYSKALSIQSEVASLPQELAPPASAEESQMVGESQSLNIVNTASVIGALPARVALSTSTTYKIKNTWFSSLKHFLFGPSD